MSMNTAPHEGLDHIDIWEISYYYVIGSRCKKTFGLEKT